MKEGGLDKKKEEHDLDQQDQKSQFWAVRVSSHYGVLAYLTDGQVASELNSKQSKE